MSLKSIVTPTLPGLLWAMRFDEGGRGHLVDEAVDFAKLTAFGEGFLWLHFDLNAADLDRAIRDGQITPARLATSAFGPDNHQRVTVEGSYVGGVVADLSRPAHGTETEDVTGRLHFVMGPRSLVSECLIGSSSLSSSLSRRFWPGTGRPTRSVASRQA